MLSRKTKRRERRRWQTELYRKRFVYSGTSLLAGLKSQEFNGQYKKFTLMAPADFELLINLIGPKIVKRDTRLRPVIPFQERVAVALQFLATGDSYTRPQYLFQISKQTFSLYPKCVSDFSWGTDGKHTGKKLCIVQRKPFCTIRHIS
jgi:hypothetical protein